MTAHRLFVLASLTVLVPLWRHLPMGQTTFGPGLAMKYGHDDPGIAR
jgi:hypothetical protein